MKRQEGVLGADLELQNLRVIKPMELLQCCFEVLSSTKQLSCDSSRLKLKIDVERMCGFVGVHLQDGHRAQRLVWLLWLFGDTNLKLVVLDRVLKLQDRTLLHKALNDVFKLSVRKAKFKQNILLLIWVVDLEFEAVICEKLLLDHGPSHHVAFLVWAF